MLDNKPPYKIVNINLLEIQKLDIPDTPPIAVVEAPTTPIPWKTSVFSNSESPIVVR
jgi:hypothetical protein